MYYTFTLSDDDNTKLDDNPTFNVPVYQAFSLGTGVLELNPGTTEIEITLPAGTTADDYRALVAQITPEGADGTYTDIATRAGDADGWSVEAKFNNDNTATLAITAGTSIRALLHVTLFKNDGSELAASCIVSLSHVIDEAAKTYIVYTPQGLRAWADIYWNYNCTLAADIDMSGQKWPVIGGFEHTFDGAGHIIRNLSFTGKSTAGFITELRGTVKNLLLENATISGHGNVGGIVGRLLNGTVIACAVSGCKVSGTLNVGGIAGMTDIGSATSVTACYATSCDIEGPENVSGHIAGRGESVFFSACYYDGAGNGYAGLPSYPGAVEQLPQSGWQTAVQNMNSQLVGNDYIWAENTDPATKDFLPLVLVRRP